MTAPVFQPPTPPPPTRTGTCPECGRENVPLLGRRALEVHTEQRVNGRHNGLPVYVDTDVACDGSGGPPEPGTVSKPWSSHPRGSTMPAGRRTQILNHGGAA
jgi:hypothetical protein